MVAKSKQDATDKILRKLEPCYPDGRTTDYVRLIFMPRVSLRTVENLMRRLAHDGLVFSDKKADGRAVFQRRPDNAKAAMSETMQDRMDIYRFRPLKSLFSQHRPARFDVR